MLALCREENDLTEELTSLLPIEQRISDICARKRDLYTEISTRLEHAICTNQITDIRTVMEQLSDSPWISSHVLRFGVAYLNLEVVTLCLQHPQVTFCQVCEARRALLHNGLHLPGAKEIRVAIDDVLPIFSYRQRFMWIKLVIVYSRETHRVRSW